MPAGRAARGPLPVPAARCGVPAGGCRERVHLDVVEERPYRFRVEPRDGMRVPGVVFASRELLRDAEQSLRQVAGVATDVAAGGVVSPGGVGSDIS